MIQLDLFGAANEMDTLLREIEKVKRSSDNVRKSIFGKIAELEEKLRRMQGEKP